MKTLSLFLITALASTSLVAQSSNILGPRNAAFLEGLWRAGYIEEAKRVGELVAASDLPEAEKRAVSTIFTRLGIAIAAQKGDARQRKDLVIQSLRAKSQRLEGTTLGSDAANEQLSELLEDYRLLADAMVEAIGQEADVPAKEALAKEGGEIFTAGTVMLTERKDKSEALRKEGTPETDIPFLISFYGLGRLYYYNSLLHGPETVQAERLVEKALNTLSEFDLEFGASSLLAVEAKLTVALCYKQMSVSDKKHMETALATLDEAIALREAYDKGKDGVYAVEPDAADVIAAAVQLKALFFKDQKEPRKIVELADNYLATIPRAMESQPGLAIVAAKCDALLELGETEGVSALAQRLVELDPKGRWGYRGQEILSQLVTGGGGAKGQVGPEKLVKIAESLAGQSEFEQALRMCRQTILVATAPEEGKFAAEALLITGAIYATREMYHEASVAFDAVVRRFPKQESAPDALWRSITCFTELEDSDKLPLFKKMQDERISLLTRDYPTHPHVARLQLREGERLVKAQKHLEAAAQFERVAPDSAVALDARYMASVAYLNQAKKLEGLRQLKDAQPFLAKAMDGFKNLLPDLTAAVERTADAKAKEHLRLIDFNSRVSLAQRYLASQTAPAEAKAGAEQAMTILKPLEGTQVPSQISTIAALRIRGKIVQGLIDDAVADMDAALGKGGDTKPLMFVAKQLAAALDERAVEKNKQKETSAATALWEKAVGLYMSGVGNSSAQEKEEVANRLFVIGLIANGVDQNQEAAYELPEFACKDRRMWDGALGLYSQVIEAEKASYKTYIGRARLFGFMQKWAEADADLTHVFAENKMAATNSGLNSALIAKRPELLNAYIEHGFALRNVGKLTNDKAKRAMASAIFGRVATGVPLDTKQWWFARFGQVQCFLERGLYDEADVSMKSLERTNPGFDEGRFGLNTRLAALKQEIARKVPLKPGAPKPAEKPPEKPPEKPK